MSYLLDTDHISILERTSGAEFGRLLARVSSIEPSEVACSIVSFRDQLVGCHAYINAANPPSRIIRGYGMLGTVLRMFARSPTLPFDRDAADIFDDLRSRRLRIATMDLRIASIAISRGLTLLTRNASDFGKIPG